MRYALHDRQHHTVKISDKIPEGYDDSPDLYLVDEDAEGRYTIEAFQWYAERGIFRLTVSHVDSIEDAVRYAAILAMIIEINNRDKY